MMWKEEKKKEKKRWSMKNKLPVHPTSKNVGKTKDKKTAKQEKIP